MGLVPPGGEEQEDQVLVSPGPADTHFQEVHSLLPELDRDGLGDEEEGDRPGLSPHRGR